MRAGTKNERFRDYLADFVAVSEFVLALFLLSGSGAPGSSMGSGKF